MSKRFETSYRGISTAPKYPNIFSKFKEKSESELFLSHPKNKVLQKPIQTILQFQNPYQKFRKDQEITMPREIRNQKQILEHFKLLHPGDCNLNL